MITDVLAGGPLYSQWANRFTRELQVIKCVSRWTWQRSKRLKASFNSNVSTMWKTKKRFLKAVMSYLVAGLSSVSVCCGELGEVGASSPSWGSSSHSASHLSSSNSSVICRKICKWHKTSEKKMPIMRKIWISWKCDSSYYKCKIRNVLSWKLHTRESVFSFSVLHFFTRQKSCLSL